MDSGGLAVMQGLFFNCRSRRCDRCSRQKLRQWEQQKRRQKYIINAIEEAISQYCIDHKTSYSQYPYEDEFNALENNLESLRQNTFLFDDSEQKEWYENQRTPNYEDFNRLERACLLFKEGFESQKSMKRRLSFRLGTFRAIQV